MKMFKKRKSKKVSPNEKYLLAYMFKGSVVSLLRFIEEHPGGKDAARRDIIKIKYNLAKCHPVLRNLVIKMVKRYDCFKIDDSWYDEYKCIITDNTNSLQFECQKVFGGDVYIKIIGGSILTNTYIEHQMLMYAIMCVHYVKDNIKALDEEQRAAKTKQRYIDAYR